MRKKLITLPTACVLTSFSLTAFAATSSQGHVQAAITEKDVTLQATNNSTD